MAWEPPGSCASCIQLRPIVFPSSSVPQRRASGTHLVPSSGTVTVTWGFCRVTLYLDDIHWTGRNAEAIITLPHETLRGRRASVCGWNVLGQAPLTCRRGWRDVALGGREGQVLPSQVFAELLPGQVDPGSPPWLIADN